MSTLFRWLLPVCLGIALLASASSANSAGDGVAVDPQHHKLEFETDKVRVIRGSFGPYESSPDFFDTLPSVIVRLTATDFRIHTPDGGAFERKLPAGAVATVPGGRIRPENLAGEVIEFIVIETKPGREGSPGSVGADPLAVDAAHYKLEFENEQIRVLRTTMEPKGKSVMHGHGPHLAVFLTNTKTLMHLPGGRTFVSVRKRGEVVNAPAGEHLPENLLDEATEVIVIEPK
jgi:hypothetical protein